MKKQQSGFTLVEIAIVMVIIGLLLGGVLKGQEVINNARIKNVNNDYNGVSAAVYSYQDRYRALPGDDSAADAHVGVITNANGGGGGVIDGAFDAVCTAPIAAADAESCKAWSHLRSAGLISGAGASGALPTNAFGGVMGIESDAETIVGLVVGFSTVPPEVAQILDVQNDDGAADTGDVQTLGTGPAYADMVNAVSMYFKF
ncbi:MAG: prepilin-type N-terminal cleavage/methylation domain-containing protein [Gammaproteobacteria bacterium]|nr:prepilin-type N-terminal cleavage/methylation domain-containing protein [Gammaproteobacteria bacterium]